MIWYIRFVIRFGTRTCTTLIVGRKLVKRKTNLHYVKINLFRLSIKAISITTYPLLGIVPFKGVIII